MMKLKDEQLDFEAKMESKQDHSETIVQELL